MNREKIICIIRGHDWHYFTERTVMMTSVPYFARECERCNKFEKNKKDTSRVSFSFDLALNYPKAYAIAPIRWAVWLADFAVCTRAGHKWHYHRRSDSRRCKRCEWFQNRWATFSFKRY